MHDIYLLLLSDSEVSNDSFRLWQKKNLYYAKILSHKNKSRTGSFPLVLNLWALSTERNIPLQDTATTRGLVAFFT